MRIERDDLSWAVGEGLLSEAQAEALWAALERRQVGPPSEAAAARPPFDFVHVAYYFGALLVIGAMGWFMNLGWEQFGGSWIFSISAIYALAFVLIGQRLWRSAVTRIPGGLLITMAVCMTPLGVYGLERWLGLWPAADPGSYRDFHEYVRGGWIAMEYVTIVAALVALRFFHFPFLTAPIAFTLWYMSMDLAPLLYGGHPSWNVRCEVSLAVGLGMLIVAYVVDRRTRDDYAFWGYLFGLFAFWGGLSMLEGSSQLNRFLYCLINSVLIVVSVLFQRRAFLVFGALGVTGYLGYLSYNVFRDSPLFPFALSGLGIGIIAAAIAYQRRRARIETVLVAATPAWLRRFLPTERTGPV
jgi:hypothetical protein